MCTKHVGTIRKQRPKIEHSSQHCTYWHRIQYMLYYSIYVCFQAACDRNSMSWPSVAGLPQDFQVRVCEEAQGWPDLLGDLSYLKSFILHYPRWRDMKDSAPVFRNMLCIYQVRLPEGTFNEDWESSRRHLPREAWSTGSTSSGLSQVSLWVCWLIAVGCGWKAPRSAYTI